MPTVSFICLANSSKHGGRCVAGLRIDGNGWIRPIGPSSSGELDFRHYRLPDGSEPQVLDLLEVELGHYKPEPHQPENYLISGRKWRLLERPASKKYLNLLDSHLVQCPELFGNYSDRVAYDTFVDKPAEVSLALVQPENLRWIIDQYEEKRKTRAFFDFRGRIYDLAITDPRWKRRLSHLPVGTHALTKAGLGGNERILLTISLGEPFEGFCYKLVAAVILLPM